MKNGSARIVDDLAARLDTALATGTPAERPPSSLTLADGYQVQEAWRRRRVARGSRAIGYKIGLTSPAAQRQRGASEPGRGTLFDDTVHSSGATISSRFPLAFEVELAVRLAGPVRRTDDDTTILSKLSRVGVAVEVVSSRWTDDAPDLGAWAADNAMATAVVVGTPVVPAEQLPRVIQATGELDTQQFSAALSTIDAFDSLRWLAGNLEVCGTPLSSDTLVLTGAIVGPCPVPRFGGVLLASLAGLNQVLVRFQHAGA